MTIRLDDTIAVVTGAAGGIGRAVCQSLKDAGATVIATDLAGDAEVPAAAAYYPHDVSRETDWARIADTVRARYGRLDALVNAAAIARVMRIEDTSLDIWRKVQSVNVESILLSMRAMLGLLQISGKTRKGGASIVNFSSVGGQRGAAFAAAYCSSKGAVKLLTKSAAIEFAALGYGIRVNSRRGACRHSRRRYRARAELRAFRSYDGPSEGNARRISTMIWPQGKICSNLLQN